MAWRFRPSPPPFDVRKKEDSALVNVDAGDELKVGLITEHSLGIATEGNIFSKIVDQGSNIPIEITKKEYTNSGPSEYTPVEIYQGEGEHIFENTLIGTLALGPMEPKPRGSHQFAVTFKLDVNGLLSTTVHHVNEGKTYQGKFENITGVGGDDKLAPMRNKLLQFYAQKSSSVSSAGMPPPPPVSQSVKPSQPEVPTETATSSHASSATTTGPEKTTRAQEEPQPKEPTAAGSDLSTVAGIIEPTIEVPEQFKAIVRRAKKQLVKEINAELLKAYNDFATALNSGKSIKDLEPIGDDLADAYDDARR
jgi:molecular chaperone DnaK